MFVVHSTTAKVGKVCKLACKLKLARFASSNILYVHEGVCNTNI